MTTSHALNPEQQFRCEQDRHFVPATFCWLRLFVAAEGVEKTGVDELCLGCDECSSLRETQQIDGLKQVGIPAVPKKNGVSFTGNALQQSEDLRRPIRVMR